jgi:hypothetical protein
MYSNLILRYTSQVLSAILGGTAVFCLYYAVILGDLRLLMLVLKFGGPAIIVAYCQDKYLS